MQKHDRALIETEETRKTGEFLLADLFRRARKFTKNLERVFYFSVFSRRNAELFQNRREAAFAAHRLHPLQLPVQRFERAHEAFDRTARTFRGFAEGLQVFGACADSGGGLTDPVGGLRVRRENAHRSKRRCKRGDERMEDAAKSAAKLLFDLI